MMPENETLCIHFSGDDLCDLTARWAESNGADITTAINQVRWENGMWVGICPVAQMVKNRDVAGIAQLQKEMCGCCASGK